MSTTNPDRLEPPSLTHLGILCFILSGAVFGVVTPSPEFPVGTSISTGDSMGDTQPSLLLYVEGQPEIGDTVLFNTPSGYVHHRVVDDTGEAWVTRGDAREQRDGPIPKSSWVGLVVLEIPLSYLAGFASLAMAAIAVYRLREVMR